MKEAVDLNRKIETLRSRLERRVLRPEDLTEDHVVALSQQLDKLVLRMQRKKQISGKNAIHSDIVSA